MLTAMVLDKLQWDVMYDEKNDNPKKDSHLSTSMSQKNSRLFNVIFVLVNLSIE